MRQSVAALALIARMDDAGEPRWLAQWNSGWNAYALVGGQKRDDETFRECAIREVQEELNLQCGKEFTIADHPTAHLEYTAWSERAQEQTAYTMELFDVRLAGEEVVRQKIDADPANRWLTHDEIQTQQTSDEKPVSPTMKLILEKAGV